MARKQVADMTRDLAKFIKTEKLPTVMTMHPTLGANCQVPTARVRPRRRLQRPRQRTDVCGMPPTPPTLTTPACPLRVDGTYLEAGNAFFDMCTIQVLNFPYP